MSELPERGYTVQASNYDNSWFEQETIDFAPRLKNANMEYWKDWVVKLKFRQNKSNGGEWISAESNGTGFYINMPCTDYNVIMTAGHNLVGADKKRSENFDILTQDGKSIRVENERFRICESYENSPQPSNGASDWGAIILPANQSKRLEDGGLGFGFSLLLAVDHKDSAHLSQSEPKNSNLGELLEQNNMYVSGYRDSDPPGMPTLCTGRGKVRKYNQLEYDVATEAGISGSPVWAAYNNGAAVIAIHNYGPEHTKKSTRRLPSKSNKKSTGSRLTMEVLQTVYSWIQASYMSRTLRVNHPDLQISRLEAVKKRVLEQGLYLRFSADFNDGMIQMGKEDLDTQFDIMPAEMAPETSVRHALYAFLFKNPQGLQEGERQWVFWDLESDKARLVPELHPHCFVHIMKKITKKTKAGGARFRLVARHVGSDSKVTRKEFRMECETIKEDDFDLGIPLDSPETSFVAEKDKLIEFNYFSFE